MIRRWGPSGEAMVRTLCALALLLVGFAHKPPVLHAQAIQAADLAHYALPDGTLPDLCLSLEEGRSHHPGDQSFTGCEACRLNASTLLPAPADFSGEPILIQIGNVTPKRYAADHRQLFPANARPRGPPTA